MKTKTYLDFRQGKRQLTQTIKKGKSLDLCATFSKDYMCCNVHVVKSISNCPFECSYCFLQNYLNDGSLSVVKDTQSIIKEINERMEAEPWRFFRIGNWELGDSLALEKQTDHAKDLIIAFTQLPNALLELKTKSDCVDSILDLDHQQRTVISWSMNTETIINEQEHKTASLEKRLIAIKKVLKAGYLIGLHFDPMILYPNWKSDYEKLVNDIFSVISVEQLTWISIGSLRFNPEMKKKMEENYPAQTLTAEEMILGPDGKMRYPKPTRLDMYAHIYHLITSQINQQIDELDPLKKPIIYFCMERYDVWKSIMGYSPNSIGHLDYLFTQSLYLRYDKVIKKKPIRSKYENKL